MIKQFSWKHIGIASLLTIALCVGLFLYNQWDITRFKKSLEEDTEQTPQKQQSEKIEPIDTKQQTTLTPTESAYENTEIEVSDNEDTNMKDADFYDFLDYLDELEAEELAKLFENLDLEEDEKEALTELTEQDAENTEDIQPSSMIVNMMESGVASLAGLIELMEESTNVMSENGQERFAPVLNTLREMQVNGGGLIFHRPPADSGNYMLFFINPSPSQRVPGLSISDDNVIHEIPSNDPNKESLFLHKGNSTIVD